MVRWWGDDNFDDNVDDDADDNIVDNVDDVDDGDDKGGDKAWERNAVEGGRRPAKQASKGWEGGEVGDRDGG